MTANSITALTKLPIVFIGIQMLISCSTKTAEQAEPDLQSMSLTEDFTIPVTITEALIGDFGGLAVDEQGNIYTADTEQQKVHIFSTAGNYLDSLGRRGKGPGEFSDLHPQIKVQGDTLYVLQKEARRVELFNIQSGNVIRSVKLADAKVNGASIGGPRNIYPQKDGTLLVSFVDPYYRAPGEGDPRKKITVARLSSSGKYIDKARQQFPTPFPTGQRLVHMAGGGISIYKTSFYPELKIAATPSGALLASQSDSLRLRRYNESGSQVGTVGQGQTGVLFTSTALDSIGRDLGSNFTKAAQDVGLPPHWPAFDHLFVDDNGRTWLQRIDPGASSQQWWVFDGEGQARWKTTLPAEVTLTAVQNSKAYGIYQSETESPRVIRYSMELE